MFRSFAAIALIAVCGVSTSAPARPPAQGGTVAQFQESLKIAKQNPPEGQLISSRVETKSDGTQVYGFYFLDRTTGQMFEREVSLATGKVVKDTSKADKTKAGAGNKKDEKDEVSKDMLALLEKKITGKSKLPEGRLMEIAAKQLKDATISEMKYEKVGDDLVMTFGDLQINAETGKEVPKAAK